jgi:carbonic anhydrase
MTRPQSPAEAWTALRAGNRRFVAGDRAHPHQDVDRRAELAAGQTPFALVFGCSDSRVSAEIVFDQGLGDLFVVRTAGHVVDTGVLGSIEFGVQQLRIPLVVVLGHDSCGAVAATVTAYSTGEMPTGFVRDVVERVTPSVLEARRAGLDSLDAIEETHARHTARLLVDRSAVVARAVAEGRCAVVALAYTLTEGRAELLEAIGDLDGTADLAG